MSAGQLEPDFGDLTPGTDVVGCTWMFNGNPDSHRSSGRSDMVRPQVKGSDVSGGVEGTT